MPLLATKLYAPRVRPELVPRPRLIAQLNTGLHCKLSLISAPAGFGKTTLLSEWAAQCERPVVWLSLDEGDNDLSLFWAYLIAALQKVCPDIAALAQSMLQSASYTATRAALTTLINQIARIPEPFVLVLDDYHVISAQGVHDMLTFLLEHQPPHMHVVIATRADPPLPLARLRGRGQLVELYQFDLRFTSDEAAEFLNRVMGLDLMTEDVAALERRTEGWVAGLQMAAISMRDHDDIRGFVQAFTGSHRYILDYLSEEVLRQQPECVQEFLLQTAILDRLSGELCNVVLNNHQLQKECADTSAPLLDDAQAVLEYLERENLFVVPLDNERCWYRYHHLFADLLRQHLQRESPEIVPALHRRASKWYAHNELMGEAVKHALASEDFEWAVSLIGQVGWTTFTRGEMSTLLNWITALPKDIVAAHPRINILYAWALVKSGQLGNASELDRIEACLQAVDPQRWRGEIAAVRAYVAGVQGDFSHAVTLAEQALAHLSEEDPFLRAIVAQNLGVAYHWSGKPPSAVQALNQAIKLSQAAGQAYQQLTAMAILGRAHEMGGALHQAAEIYKHALKLAAELGEPPVPFACMAYIGMASVLYEWNDLDDAACHARAGLRLSEMGGFVAYQIFGYALLARIHEARGERDKALAMLGKVTRLGQSANYMLVLALAAEVRVRVWLAQGDHAAVTRWIGEHKISTGEDLDAAHEVMSMIVARAWIAQGQPDRAHDVLARLLEAAQSAKRMGSVIKNLVLQALVCQAQKDLGGALSALERALSLAEREGYARTFMDEGEAMAHLLRQICIAQPTHTQSASERPEAVANYAAWLLSALEEENASRPSAREEGVIIEPLTDREREVLRLIVAGLSNQEIAEALFIAMSTVKSHINHIYGKLGVEDRTQAVLMAQNLNLL